MGGRVVGLVGGALLLLATDTAVLTSYGGFSSLGAGPSTTAGIATPVLTAGLVLGVARRNSTGGFICRDVLDGRVT